MSNYTHRSDVKPSDMEHSLSELKAMPTLCTGQTCNLKIETVAKRVWLCRCGVADGLMYDNQVTVEHCVNGQWSNATTYEAK